MGTVLLAATTGEHAGGRPQPRPAASRGQQPPRREAPTLAAERSISARAAPISARGSMRRSTLPTAGHRDNGWRCMWAGRWVTCEVRRRGLKGRGEVRDASCGLGLEGAASPWPAAMLARGGSSVGGERRQNWLRGKVEEGLEVLLRVLEVAERSVELHGRKREPRTRARVEEWGRGKKDISLRFSLLESQK